MKKFAFVLAATITLTFSIAAPVFAGNAPTTVAVRNTAESEYVRGAIKEVDTAAKAITVKETTFKYDDKTKVVKDAGKPATVADLVKGANITARVNGGLASRIEIHTAAKK
jgi:hypothetical protein